MSARSPIAPDPAARVANTVPAPQEPSSASFATGEATLFAPTYTLPRLELVSGRGATVTDVSGREYLDFVSGIAVNAFGHAPAGLARVVAKQMRTLVHTSNLFTSGPSLALARALTEATGYPRVFFCNSGTEGIETALKFARAHARSRERSGRDIVAFRGGFHGRTGFALSATYTPGYREPFEPLIPGVRFAAFNDIVGLDQALDESVCAVVVEPVQGEGGAVAATPAFMRALRARCDAHGILLVLDEIQCGMGRSGRLLASEHSGVRGDMVVLSKALGGGLPLGAVLLTESVASALSPGIHGTTFGGGPVTTAAAGWVLERVRKPAFLARVRRHGKRLRAGLDALVTRHAALTGTRGLGLLLAIKLAADAPFGPLDVVNAARAHGLLLVRAGERAVRLLPPLTVSADEIDQALARLDAALHSLVPSEDHRS